MDVADHFRPRHAQQIVRAEQWNLVVGVYKNMDASKVHRVFLNLDYRKQWDKYTLEAKVIDRGVATDTDVVYQSTKFPFPFSNRDYVFSR